MITIHATKKLSAKLPSGISPIDSTGTTSELDNNPLSGWHANLLILQRRNCVLLVHDVTRFPLFIKGLLKADCVEKVGFSTFLANFAIFCAYKILFLLEIKFCLQPNFPRKGLFQHNQPISPTSTGCLPMR